MKKRKPGVRFTMRIIPVRTARRPTHHPVLTVSIAHAYTRRGVRGLEMLDVDTLINTLIYNIENRVFSFYILSALSVKCNEYVKL